MLIVLNLHLMAVILFIVGLMLMVMVLILHPLHQLFLQNVHVIHHGQHLHGRGVRSLQNLGQPLLHSAAVAD